MLISSKVQQRLEVIKGNAEYALSIHCVQDLRHSGLPYIYWLRFLASLQYAYKSP